MLCQPLYPQTAGGSTALALPSLPALHDVNMGDALALTTHAHEDIDPDVDVQYGEYQHLLWVGPFTLLMRV